MAELSLKFCLGFNLFFSSQNLIPEPSPTIKHAVYSCLGITYVTLLFTCHISNISGGIDFAHEASGFLTWHRLLLLWFEREVQVTIPGQTDFTLSYWDWTDTDERETYFEEGYLKVSDEPFSSWPTYCWFEKQDGTICDLSTPTAKLHRCPKYDYCNKLNSLWPNQDDVEDALSQLSYDTDPYNKLATYSFRNYLEGFLPVQSCTNQGALCEDSLNRKLHNSVS